MATSWASLLSSALCVLLFCQGSLGQLPFSQGQQPQQARRFREQRQCRVEMLEAVQPSRMIQAEAGMTEYWDQNDDQFQCAGVAPYRTTIQPRGLLLPYFSNSPRLIYVIQGTGITGSVMPGCPETFQSFQRPQALEERRPEQRYRDQHQRISQYRAGDVIALNAGVATWFYNDGDMPVVTVTVADTSNYANQLDRRLRKFQLAGSQQQRETYGSQQQRKTYGSQQQRETYGGEAAPGEEASGNILSGFDAEMLAEALGVSREIAVKLQSHDDRRGNIVRVEEELQVVRPERRRFEQEEGRDQSSANGMEEDFCTARHKENIDDASRADVYSPRVGRVTTLNSQKLPILRYLQMSVERGVLHMNAHYTPHWHMNAHSILYVIRGRARVQMSGYQGRARFDREVRQGQVVVIPQNFAVAAQATSEEDFEWVSFKTNDNAMVSPMAGKASVFRGLPLGVIQNSYRISSEEARRVKYGRSEEFLVLRPRGQGMRASA